MKESLEKDISITKKSEAWQLLLKKNINNSFKKSITIAKKSSS